MLRLCADFFTGFNEALKLHQFSVPNLEDIFATLGGGTIFLHIDFSEAFFQIEVDDRTKKLLVINTHMGLFSIQSFAF